MSRTPQYDITKLPLWAQEYIADQKLCIEELEAELEMNQGWVNNLEDSLEYMAKNDLTPGTDQFTVDL